MKIVDEIIKESLYCNIATVRENGAPWNTPVFFVGNIKDGIVWWSAHSSVHSKNIYRDSRVFITMYNSKEVEGQGTGVYIQAIAEELVDDEDIELALKAYNKKAKSFKLSKNHASGSAPTRMYKATVDRVWINDGEEKNGYYADIRKEVL